MRRVLLTALMACVLMLSSALAVGAAQHAKHGAPRHSWQVMLSAPAPLDYALGEISFKVSSRVRPRLALSGPIGADYVAAGQLRSSSTRRLRVLVFILDRATALMDPASIGLSLRLSTSVAAPQVLEVLDGFASRGAVSRPKLCDLPLDGRPFEQADLRSLLASGEALPGFSSVAAITQAYNVSCGMPFQAAFQQAVTETPASSPPPSPGPPGCEPCKAPPGYACPLLASASVCIAPVTATRR